MIRPVFVVDHSRLVLVFLARNAEFWYTPPCYFDQRHAQCRLNEAATFGLALHHRRHGYRSLCSVGCSG